MNFGELSWGKKNRLAQMFKPDKNGEHHTVMFAIDHSYFMGPIRGLEDPRKTIRPLVKYADCISPARGTLEYCLDPLNPIPVILRISGGTSIERKVYSDEAIMTCVEDAVKLNAIGVSVQVLIGSEHERQTIKNLSEAVRKSEKYGLLVLGVVAVGEELEEKKNDARYLKLAGRIIQEFGANIVKTYWCKNEFEEVRNGIQTPIVIAGGKGEGTMESLVYTYNSIQGRADGVDMGRKIFQNEYPEAMIRAVRSIVHDGLTTEEAFDFYNHLVQEKK